MWTAKIREVFPPLFLLINSVTWFSLTWFVVEGLIGTAPFDTILLVSSSYFGALLVSAIIGATFLKKKLRGKTSLLAWVSLGALVCAVAPTMAPGSSSVNLALVSIPLGGLAGLGIPTCLAFFSENSKSNNRGRNGAVVFFIIQAITAALYVSINTTTIDTNAIQNQFMILAAWRLIGVASVFFIAPKAEATEERKTRLTGIVRERTFFLYFVPWFLLVIVNFIEEPLIEHNFGTAGFIPYSDYTIATILIISIAAFLGGVLCDYRGRKVSSILGFVMLGLGFAFLTLLPGTLISEILYVVFGGIAWGVLYVTFIFVVWGDMAEGTGGEKYYVLGCMPFLFSNLISVLVQPFAFAGDIPIASSFSLASLFLFVAILPLLYAPETLAEKILKDRELKNYIAKAKKEVAKSQNKEDESTECEKKDEEDSVEFKVNQEDDEKARELAEKYY
jgi:MFS family permease